MTDIFIFSFVAFCLSPILFFPSEAAATTVIFFTLNSSGRVGERCGERPVESSDGTGVWGEGGEGGIEKEGEVERERDIYTVRLRD